MFIPYKTHIYYSVLEYVLPTIVFIDANVFAAWFNMETIPLLQHLCYCRHSQNIVSYFTLSVTVRVDSDSSQSWYGADVLYRNKREQPVFDVGLISLRGYDDKCLHELDMAESCNEGKRCIECIVHGSNNQNDGHINLLGSGV